MIEKRAGSPTRRAYTALACWYVLACCLPAVFAAILTGSQSGDTPGYSYVDGRAEPCAGHFGCPTGPSDTGSVLLGTALILAPSLLVAVPLCAYLVRKWGTPAYAGFVAALTGWLALCVGGLLYLSS